MKQACFLLIIFAVFIIESFRPISSQSCHMYGVLIHDIGTLCHIGLHCNVFVLYVQIWLSYGNLYLQNGGWQWQWQPSCILSEVKVDVIGSRSLPVSICI